MEAAAAERTFLFYLASYWLYIKVQGEFRKPLGWNAGLLTKRSFGNCCLSTS